jgi:CheY-like chemotaxis protein
LLPMACCSPTSGERQTVPAGNTKTRGLRAQCERLREELELTRRAAQSAEERIQTLVRERDALVRMNQRARRPDSMGSEAIRELAGRFAHDLNNVLAGITSGLELRVRIGEPERRARLIKRIEDAAWRGSDLTRGLRVLACPSDHGSQAENRAGQRGNVSVLLSPAADSHLSVLVVEDDDEMAAVVTDMLERLGHRGLRVSTVPAAVAVLSGGEAVDLIFADVLLSGGGSGFDLAREIESRKLRLPIVLTSGFGVGMRDRLAAVRLPFLPKPYTLAGLQEMLQRAAGVGL